MKLKLFSLKPSVLYSFIVLLQHEGSDDSDTAKFKSCETAEVAPHAALPSAQLHGN